MFPILKWVPDKDYALGMEAFGSAVVHDKSGALGMDNPAEIKYLFFVNFEPLWFKFSCFFRQYFWSKALTQ
jgi:hypothetical protein